jgi:hypothetical protein
VDEPQEASKKQDDRTIAPRKPYLKPAVEDFLDQVTVLGTDESRGQRRPRR